MITRSISLGPADAGADPPGWGRVAGLDLSRCCCMRATSAAISAEVSGLATKSKAPDLTASTAVRIEPFELISTTSVFGRGPPLIRRNSSRPPRSETLMSAKTMSNGSRSTPPTASRPSAMTAVTCPWSAKSSARLAPCDVSLSTTRTFIVRNTLCACAIGSFACASRGSHRRTVPARRWSATQLGMQVQSLVGRYSPTRSRRRDDLIDCLRPNSGGMSLNSIRISPPLRNLCRTKVVTFPSPQFLHILVRCGQIGNCTLPGPIGIPRCPGFRNRRLRWCTGKR